MYEATFPEMDLTTMATDVTSTSLLVNTSEKEISDYTETTMQTDIPQEETLNDDFQESETWYNYF